MTLALDRAATATPTRRWIGPLALRYALRELRGGLSGFYVFVACIALGVMAIAGVGSVAASLADGLSREGRTLLGGDVAFSLIQREASPQERAFLDAHGRVSAAATLRGMVRAASGEFALVELKAVDGNYPMLGRPTLAPDMPVADALAPHDGVYGAAADPTLLARLDLKVGDRVSIAGATFAITTAIDAEPDKLAGGVGFGPRFLISIDGLRATGLLQPGSLVRWTYRVKLADTGSDDRAAEALITDARAALPEAGWDIRSRANASPQLERSISRFTQFLTLVGLAALLVGGVGVANAVKSHIDRRRDAIATLKSLGAPGRDVFTIYLMQVVVLAAVGSLIGLAVGAALPFIIAKVFGHLLPLPIEPSLHGGELALSLLYGLLTALAFGLWPLGTVHDVPVARLFRDAGASDWRWPRRRYLVLMAVVIALLVAIAIGLAYDKRVAAVFVAASVVVFALLRLVAGLVMLIARRLPRPQSTMLRLALGNIHRIGALTPSVVLSLGLGLTVLVTIAQIDGNLRRQFLAALPEHAPSFFFIDIPAPEAGRFGDFLQTLAPGAHVERVPMLRGRITAANGVKAESLKPTTQAEWVLQSDRGLTYTNEVPKGSKVVEGTWWSPDYSGPPLVSMEKKIADGLGLKLGDTVTVNVLGRDITATISNLRDVDWQSLGINFVLVFTPKTFAGAPHTHLATLSEPHPSAAGDAAIIKAVAAKYPMVTSVRVRDALRTVGDVVENLVLAIRGASALTLVAAVLVLGGALAAGHRHRVYDAVILKTLGATRTRLIGAYALEYLMIGLATAVFGVIAGSIAAWLIVTRLMTLSFTWQAGSAALVVIAALVVTVGLGLLGTLAALNQKPAQVLRNL
ncbi:FtsX-like permease family protein [Bradyrhizobium sp. U87765 SZCCT0131]|uniref:ABC transporter permease n=1 Tax=unclassified Bradyrhizobium TaxID=2631580 RepID=UPI001BA96441|nr:MULTISPECIES: FtsX-like permease family protein [unclassified Bradyrhizobium]MBR1217011.1 FtsX-like permease family protein [Bradyrhizobium sp. U87765 SZCCT0131]MBR1259233.1 FtsX-like permease family protein [Bradyrhizobium sp. U87765 SZCCT0134]MBR1305374.1 FtsX-like permease family protein [Bradyrhizobium sp. U87765 SZCCT0110]MBR1321160.1 FtsX-like permease family protein [Bradyrhizobium sp. U87765 SZCCT0109]MBR1350186.1 FtsX-like permease family protein [Bradyrhizobium sp. U87765 SZCCT004